MTCPVLWCSWQCIQTEPPIKDANHWWFSLNTMWSFQLSSVVLHLKCIMERWREVTIPGEPVWATVVFTATSCPLLLCWPAREMGRGRETFRSVCVSWPTVASCTDRSTSSRSCHGFLQSLNCVCVTEAVLCGDPGSPGGGYREGNIFSYRSVVTCCRCCSLLMLLFVSSLLGGRCLTTVVLLLQQGFYNSCINLKKKMLILNAYFNARIKSVV